MRQSVPALALLPTLLLAACGPSGQEVPVSTTVPAAETKPASAAARLDREMAEYWDGYGRTYPLAATTSGDMRFNDRLGSFTAEARAAELARLDAHLAALSDIDRAALPAADRTNYDIFKWMLENERAHDALPSARYFLFNSYSGWHIGFSQAVSRTPLRARDDYDDYVSRLNDFSRYADEAIVVLREGVGEGWVHSCAPLKGYGDTISGMIATDPSESFAFAPVAEIPEKFAGDADSIQTAVKTAIETSVNPGLQRFYDFYTEEYEPACRAEAGIGSIANGGPTAYETLVNFYATTDDMTAEEVHALGLSEVARIRTEMEEIKSSTTFDGTLEEFFTFLRTDPAFFPRNATHYMEFTADLAKRIDRKLPEYFETLPRNPFTITPIPAAQAPKTTMAYYSPGSLKNGVAGQYYLNFHALNTRSLNELPALTLHEAAPGHHTQISLQQEMPDIPEFRKHYYISAYGEGWALYTEYLGEEMGIYQSPYEQFGRLTFEMWRALRLVVDTGLHAKGWTRQQAVDYMAANSSLSLQNINAEVDRYITWPGQAISYKLGELKIKELRRRAETELGDDFNLRAFHSHLLAGGAMPLAALEIRMDEWIEAQK